MPNHLSKRQAKKLRSERATLARMTKFTRIVLEQGGLCWFCGEEMGSDCTREHLLAVTLGGGNERGNLRAAHGECNSAAGHLPVSDKMRLRAIGHSEGRKALLELAKQLRRADARLAFSGEKTPKPRKIPHWTSDAFSPAIASLKSVARIKP